MPLPAQDVTPHNPFVFGTGGCIAGDYTTTSGLAVSLSRGGSDEHGHTHAVSVTLKDDDATDVFALSVAQDPVYGTPIFTTLGGKSSCPGETGTTRKDSKVTIKKVEYHCEDPSWKSTRATGRRSHFCVCA